MYRVDRRKKKINEAAKEKHKDKEVNRRYCWGAAAQEQLQLTGCINDFHRMDKLGWNSNFVPKSRAAHRTTKPPSPLAY